MLHDEHSCNWVTFPNGPGTEAKRCECSAVWTVVRDEDGNFVRKYKSFCKEHQKLAELEDDCC